MERKLTAQENIEIIMNYLQEASNRLGENISLAFTKTGRLFSESPEYGDEKTINPLFTVTSDENVVKTMSHKFDEWSRKTRVVKNDIEDIRKLAKDSFQPIEDSKQWQEFWKDQCTKIGDATQQEKTLQQIRGAFLYQLVSKMQKTRTDIELNTLKFFNTLTSNLGQGTNDEIAPKIVNIKISQNLERLKKDIQDGTFPSTKIKAVVTGVVKDIQKDIDALTIEKQECVDALNQKLLTINQEIKDLKERNPETFKAGKGFKHKTAFERSRDRAQALDDIVKTITHNMLVKSSSTENLSYLLKKTEPVTSSPNKLRRASSVGSLSMYAKGKSKEEEKTENLPKEPKEGTKKQP